MTRRRREIGVRMALGACSRDVRRLIVGKGAALSLAGVVLGLLGAVGLTTYLEALLFEVQARDWKTYAAAALFLLAAAMLASYFPARRACRQNPNTVLREGV